ncbi:glycine cleavage system aminomethyltransferase GcvT [bacterium]|nr:glycine cleavage system aminomethyltransferase GcvT [bacterium]
MSDPDHTTLKTTPLHALHQRLGARFGAFGGYDMPIQYPDGILSEHLWTRSQCGLFDVSHMGPCFLALPELGGGDAAHRRVAALVEKLVPSDIANLPPGKMQLTVLLNESGGILDDLMIGRPARDDRQGMLYIVVNAGTKDQDFALLSAAADGEAQLRRADDRGLIAIQGPKAESVLEDIVPGVSSLSFMTFARFDHSQFGRMLVTRCGYTGEDGFEVLVLPDHAVAFTERVLADARVKPIGLGARDSLRLEAGLCLYGHDIDADTSPVEAGLSWMISKSRRERGDFPGAERILGELKAGPAARRVGVRPLGRAPAREGAEIQTREGDAIGRVTSGGFGPTVNGPVAMGHVASSHAKPGTPVQVIVRGKPFEAEIAALPFTPHNYKR